jgi:predicted short-subunit dehydrogenase-like oxidoreductase (DUF2520 family)
VAVYSVAGGSQLHALTFSVTAAAACGAAATQTLTEQMISGMVYELKGSYKIQYHADGPDAAPIEIDFTPPW